MHKKYGIRQTYLPEGDRSFETQERILREGRIASGKVGGRNGNAPPMVVADSSRAMA